MRKIIIIILIICGILIPDVSVLANETVNENEQRFTMIPF